MYQFAERSNCKISCLSSVAIHRIPKACKSLAFIKINLFGREEWVPCFKIYLRGRTKIANGKLKSKPAWCPEWEEYPDRRRHDRREIHSEDPRD